MQVIETEHSRYELYGENWKTHGTKNTRDKTNMKEVV